MNLLKEYLDIIVYFCFVVLFIITNLVLIGLYFDYRKNNKE